MKGGRLALFVSALSVANPVLAHHSFAMFDMATKVTLIGTVTTFEWTNPHSYIEVDVPDGKGAVKHLSVELGSPSILQQAGWKFSALKSGDHVTLVINPLKNGQAGGLLLQATLADGRVLGNGPGGGPGSAAPPPSSPKPEK